MTTTAAALPSEVLLEVVAYVERSPCHQRDLWAMTMVSRSWYSAAISSLYHRPTITGRNFTLFVRTICPSINAHIRKTSFSSMVKELDMSKLVHDSSKSLTARILSRLKEGLEVLVAPRASFAVNCLAALSKCQHLRRLDLSLVTENIGIRRLLHSLCKLSGLEQLSIRCKDDPTEMPSTVVWPPRLQHLEVSGRLTEETLTHFMNLPASLNSITINSCSFIHVQSLKSLLQSLARSLESLHIGHNTYDYTQYKHIAAWIHYLPILKWLHVCEPTFRIGLDSLAYIHSSCNVNNSSPLRVLELDCTRHGDFYGQEYGDFQNLYDAIDGGYLSQVRQVTIFHLHDQIMDRHENQMVHELDEYLQALAREDGKDATIKEEDAGVKVVRVSYLR